jgi:hypothetical protein
MKHNEYNTPLLASQLPSIVVQQILSKKWTVNEQISHAANLRSSAFICGFFLIRLAEKYSSISWIFQSVPIRVNGIMTNREMKKFCNSGGRIHE